MVTCKLADMDPHWHSSSGPAGAGVHLEPVCLLGSHLEYRDPFWTHLGCPENNRQETRGQDSCHRQDGGRAEDTQPGEKFRNSIRAVLGS